MNEVILVNHNDEAIGVMEKMEAHEKAILHRAFSVFIFNDKGKMLLHQRATGKYHSGGLWTNACCSHPSPGEEIEKAAHERLMFEMGFDTELVSAFSFIYKTEFDNGLKEHEFDHVLIGKYTGPVNPNADEVLSFDFFYLNEIQQQIASDPQKFTSWFKIAFPKLVEYIVVHPV